MIVLPKPVGSMARVLELQADEARFELVIPRVKSAGYEHQPTPETKPPPSYLTLKVALIRSRMTKDSPNQPNQTSQQVQGHRGHRSVEEIENALRS